MRKHLIIPDVQVKPGQDFRFLTAIGNYIVDKKPDVVVQIGDFADMPSLSSYDKGRKSFEGRRIKNDIEAVHEAMSVLMTPLIKRFECDKKNKHKLYTPELHLTLGNHEHRIEKATDADAELDGLISTDDLGYAQYGWTVHPFLSPVVVDGVCYNHYYPTGVLGRPCASASKLLATQHMSCVAGHQQGRQVAYDKRADGKTLTAIIAGSCYEHKEDYLPGITKEHWNGIVVLHEVVDGQYDEMFVSLRYLKENYL